MSSAFLKRHKTDAKVAETDFSPALYNKHSLLTMTYFHDCRDDYHIGQVV